MARSVILVVDDEKNIRRTLSLILEGEGYEVFTAANGALAWDQLADIRKPCLILLDLMMPVMDGFQFLEALDGSVHHGKVFVVLVSANNNLETAARLPNVVAFLRKPFELDALMDLVDCHASR